MADERKLITEIPGLESDAEEREWWDEHGADVDPTLSRQSTCTSTSSLGAREASGSPLG